MRSFDSLSVKFLFLREKIWKRYYTFCNFFPVTPFCPASPKNELSSSERYHFSGLDHVDVLLEETMKS